MTYNPITEIDKQQWIDWLEPLTLTLANVHESKDNKIFKTPDGDIASAKDLVGNFLATLKNEPVTIP